MNENKIGTLIDSMHAQLTNYQGKNSANFLGNDCFNIYVAKFFY